MWIKHVHFHALLLPYVGIECSETNDEEVKGPIELGPLMQAKRIIRDGYPCAFLVSCLSYPELISHAVWIRLWWDFTCRWPVLMVFRPQVWVIGVPVFLGPVAVISAIFKQKWPPTLFSPFQNAFQSIPERSCCRSAVTLCRWASSKSFIFMPFISLELYVYIIILKYSWRENMI